MFNFNDLNFKTFFINLKNVFIVIYSYLYNYDRVLITRQNYEMNVELEQTYDLILPFLDALEKGRQRNIDIIAVLSENKMIQKSSACNTWNYVDYVIPATILVVTLVAGYIFFSNYFPPPSENSGIDEILPSSISNVNELPAVSLVTAIDEALSSNGNESPISIYSIIDGNDSSPLL